MVTVFAQPIKHFENPPDYRDQTHVLHLRDSVTIEIKNSFANSSGQAGFRRTGAVVFWERIGRDGKSFRFLKFRRL